MGKSWRNFSCEFVGEENRHKIEDETPVKCTYSIIYSRSLTICLVFRPKVFQAYCLCMCVIFHFFFSISFLTLAPFFYHSNCIHMQISCLTSHKRNVGTYEKVSFALVSSLSFWESTEWSITKQDFFRYIISRFFFRLFSSFMRGGIKKKRWTKFFVWFLNVFKYFFSLPIEPICSKFMLIEQPSSVIEKKGKHTVIEIGLFRHVSHAEGKEFK